MPRAVVAAYGGIDAKELAFRFAVEGKRPAVGQQPTVNRRHYMADYFGMHIDSFLYEFLLSCLQYITAKPSNKQANDNTALFI